MRACSASVRCQKGKPAAEGGRATPKGFLIEEAKWRWHSERTGLLMHTNVASRGGGLLPFFLRPAPRGGGDDGASRVKPHPSTTQQ
jgi:hypothetical protein